MGMKRMRMHFNKKTVRLVILGAVFLSTLYLLSLVRGILLPFILAVVLAYILNPLLVVLQHNGFSRTSALVAVYIVGIMAMVTAFLYGFPVIVRELNDLARAVPQLTTETQDLVYSAYERYRSIPVPESISRVLNENASNIQAALIQGIQTTVNTILGFFSNLVSIVLAPILAFYLLKDWDHLGRRLMSFFPVRLKEPITTLWEEVDRVLVGFIRGHLLVATFVGVFTGIGLTIIGMDFIILLSVIAAISNLIPYFGPFIAAIPVIALALLISTTTAIQALFVMFVVQQIESNLVSPAILGESVGLHPITIVFVLLAGGSLFGILGLLLAVPVAAVSRIILGYAYSNLISD